MTVKSQTLNVMSLPLRGAQLIEASAGTGKTFTIGLLYLRLLLGIGQSEPALDPLLVEEILVVTFTEAATAELRSRIRDNIHQLRVTCLRLAAEAGAVGSDPLTVGIFGDLISAISDLPLAAKRLLQAEQQMDQAAIYTIHGFCQRMLSMHAFESGQLFEQQLVEDESQLQKQAAEDFWRRYCYPLPTEVAKIVQDSFTSPAHLLNHIQPWLQGSMPKFKTAIEFESLSACHYKNLLRINTIKQAWQQHREQLADTIRSSSVDKRSYSRTSLIKWLSIVDNWAETLTEGYHIPRELSRFSQTELQQKTRTGTVPVHPVFSMISDFLASPVTLYGLIVALALTEIRGSLNQEKQRQVILSFDDLLLKLDNALQQPIGTQLADSIRQRYPVAMVDEFQDTDPLQYRIFSAIYQDAKENGLVLIGDPKQAIYAFRGADIFTYMQARGAVDLRHSLDTNWRSSGRMIRAVNRLFSQLAKPFIFEQIPFQPIKTAPEHQHMSLKREQKTSAAVSFWLQPGAGVSQHDYQLYMARACAHDIANWISQGRKGSACMLPDAKHANGEPRPIPVQAKDIAVLVRSRHEAKLIQHALIELGIASVYLSNRGSVYNTVEALELQRVLQAILMPSNACYLKAALTTAIFGYNAEQIEQYSYDSAGFDELTHQFIEWLSIWRQVGVLPMLQNIMQRQALAENWLKQREGERRLTDLMHLGELLQAASTTLESPHAVLRYLDRKIAQPDNHAKHQQPRLASEKDLVRIITIHKAKGLEYPIVWLPFIAHYRAAEQAVYHDRVSFESTLDLANSEESQQLAEQERLAEDLRLLYVALTRSIYHCSIGIAPLFLQKRKREGDSELHLSAIGYLIQQGEPATAEGLLARLMMLSDECIEIIHAVADLAGPLITEPATEKELGSCDFSRPLLQPWRVTSYSALIQHSSFPKTAPQPLFETLPNFVPEPLEVGLTAHHFPRGADPGTFLHYLFENLNFSAPISLEWLHAQLTTQGYAADWTPVLADWVNQVLSQPLTGAGIALAELNEQDYLKEMEFHLPIEAPLDAGILSDLACQYDPLARLAEPITFRQVQGMLKGFIDLVFCHQNTYYILDYKSNWLGSDKSAYSQSAMVEAMVDHRYFLQYQLYTLALHRYLRRRIKDYHYQQHFGGVFYLFLRGMAEAEPGNGVYFTRPATSFIDKLDKLFKTGKQP